MKKVQSSNIDSIDYDSKNQVLTVNFLSGKTYEYHNVAPHEYESLEKAPSVGSHLHKNIISFKQSKQKK